MRGTQLIITYKIYKYRDIYAKESHYPIMAQQGYTKKEEIKNSDGTISITYYK
jgi:hypothetical protein